MSDQQEIRKIEKNIIDSHHLNFEILSFSKDIIIPQLLKTFGNLERDILGVIYKESNHHSTNFILRHYTEGLSYAIRWGLKSDGNKKLTETTYKDLDRMAFDLLEWGRAYSMICQSFIPWSHGFFDVVYDKSQKKIDFSPKDDFDYQFFGFQNLYATEFLNQYQDNFPRQPLERLYQLVRHKVDLSKGVFDIPWGIHKNTIAYKKLFGYFRKYILPELPIDTDIGGYSLRNYIHFYTVFYMHFNFTRYLVDEVDNKLGLENIYGSPVLNLSYNEFTVFASDLCELDKQTTSEIIKDLIFDYKRFNSKLLFQPIVNKDNQLYISPRIFCKIFPYHFLKNSLLKGRKQNIYNKLISIIEPSALDGFYNQVRKILKGKYQVYKEPKITGNNGKVITPDVVAISKDLSEVVIAEYKYYLTPFSIIDVKNKISELKKSEFQMHNYKKVIGGKFDMKGQKYDLCKARVYGLVVTDQPLQMPILKELSYTVLCKKQFIERILGRYNPKQSLYLRHELAYRLLKDLKFRYDKRMEKVGDYSVSVHAGAISYEKLIKK